MSCTPLAIAVPSLTEILVVRHAHVHNPKDILYGRLPRYRLSEHGARQAEYTAQFIAGRPVGAIYSSPLLRARQTAAAVRKHFPDLPVRLSRYLLETKTGFEGSPNSILTPEFSFYEPRKDPSDETMQDIFCRMHRFLRTAAARHAGSTIVAVSHADPITIMRVGLRGLPLTAGSLHAEVYPDRGSITQLVLAPQEPVRMAYFNPAALIPHPSQ